MPNLRAVRRVLLCVVATLSLLGGTAAAQPAPPLQADTVLARDALLHDVAILEQAYEALHPGLHRYNTPRQMRARFAALRAEFDRDRTLGDAYLALSRFAATIRCGHTYANFYNQSEAVQKALFEGDDRVPFHFVWRGGRMVVTRDFSGDPLVRPGTEVLAIDGVRSDVLLARLMAVARADGHNDAKRRALLAVQGTDRYETFDVFLPRVLPSRDGVRRYALRAPGARGVVERRLAPQTHAQRLASRVQPATDRNAPQWTLDRSDPALAVLRMPSWALYNSTWDWRAFLAQSFAQLDADSVPTLVIDLRGNEGGLGVGDVLLAHLVDRPLDVTAYRRLVRYRSVPASLAPYLDTWDPSFKDWGEDARRFDARYFLVGRWNSAQALRIEPMAPRYRGRVFVLVGASNSSATFEFAKQAKQARVATLVGQTTGGNRRGINGGAFFFLRLPRTGLEMDLPLVGQFPLKPEPDAGVEPDIPVEARIDDIAAGRDVELAAVRAALASPVAALR
ncbi:S41 family peptidase [Lysobacter humi (ex Lee et al. 2017)]